MKLAIIGAGYMAKEYALKAKEKNIKVYCFAWEEGAVAKDCVDVFYPISVLEKEHILKICKDIGIDGVIATASIAITTAAYIADKLELNSNSVYISSMIQNKIWVRLQLQKAQYIKQPVFYKLEHNKNKLNISEPVFPVIVKPVSSEGKKGVMVARNRLEYEKAVSYALSGDKLGLGIMIEEFLSEGKEYSVETISFMGEHQVIQLTEKVSSGAPHCVELGHHQPADLDNAVIERIILAINEMLNTVRWYNGPSHIEIKIINGEVYLIELNARAAGDHIASKLVWLSTEYDYLGEIINVALGIKPKKFDKKFDKRCAGIIFIVDQTKNILQHLNNCNNREWLYEKQIDNHNITELKGNDGFRVNYIIYSNNERPIWTSLV